MEAFSRAFEAMRIRPWHALGLAAILTASTVVLGVLVLVLMMFMGAGIVTQFLNEVGAGALWGFSSLGSTFGDLLGQALLVLLVGFLVYLVGSTYMAAGFLGSATTALTPNGLQVDLAAYFGYANRYVARMLLLAVLFVLGLVAYAIAVLVVASVLKDAGVVLGLWLFVSFLALVLLYLPIMSLGGAAAVLDDRGGAEAFTTAARTIGRRPAEVAVIAIVLAVIAFVISVLTTELARPFALLGGLLGAYAASVVGLFSQLVWLHFHRSTWRVGGRAAMAGGIAPAAGQVPGARTVGPNAGRLGVLDRGLVRPDIRIRPGSVLVVGRDPGADIHLDDPQVSRRHVSLALESGAWLVGDLGATNPARLLAPDGTVRDLRGSSTRLLHGQLAVGESVLTLYPLEP